MVGDCREHLKELADALIRPQKRQATMCHPMILMRCRRCSLRSMGSSYRFGLKSDSWCHLAVESRSCSSSSRAYTSCSRRVTPACAAGRGYLAGAAVPSLPLCGHRQRPVPGPCPSGRTIADCGTDSRRGQHRGRALREGGVLRSRLRRQHQPHQTDQQPLDIAQNFRGA